MNNVSSDPQTLKIQGLRKLYPAREDSEPFLALQNINLNADARDFICLLGPSGCGKTTLLNIIAGFIPVTDGMVSVGSRPVTAAGPDRGVVFQDYALFPWLTVRQNVEFGPRVLGIAKRERAELAEKYLTMVGLSDFTERFPHQLSGGMKQRVAIARALANRPSVLLMDEPFGALDAMTRETMQDELRRIASREPKLIIFVTHSIAEAVFLANRVVVMSPRPGRIVSDIRISLEHPRDRTSETFNQYVRSIREILVPVSKEVETAPT